MEHDFSPPQHLDAEYLHEKYKPLRDSIYRMHYEKMRTSADREDLQAQITQMFISLVIEYNPHLGVDFPFYIKKMLNFRTTHYVEGYIKSRSREQYQVNEESSPIYEVEDASVNDLISKIIDLNSIDPNINLGDKHRNLLIGIIIHGKSLKELAIEEGVLPERLHARFYFLKKKLEQIYQEHKKLHGDNLY